MLLDTYVLKEWRNILIDEEEEQNLLEGMLIYEEKKKHDRTKKAGRLSVQFLQSWLFFEGLQMYNELENIRTDV